jgi:hypothetical protein
MNSGEYVNGGGMSLHAPSIIAMGKDAFIAFYIDRITFIQDVLQRRKYLTGKYEECEELMNPVRYKSVLSTPADEVSAPVDEPKDVSTPVKRTSKARKSTEKKE